MTATAARNNIDNMLPFVCVCVLYKLFSKGMHYTLQAVQHNASPPSLSVCLLTCLFIFYLSHDFPSFSLSFSLSFRWSLESKLLCMGIHVCKTGCHDKKSLLA